MAVKTVSIDALYRDLYPGPGERIKQWVIDRRNERAWVLATCPRVEVPNHIDNCTPDGYDPALDAEYGPPIGGHIPCRNVGSTIWDDLDHDSCYFCGDLQRATQNRPDIIAWRAERASRPPICTDRDKLSDEVQPDLRLADHPMLALLRRRTK